MEGWQSSAMTVTFKTFDKLFFPILHLNLDSGDSYTFFGPSPGKHFNGTIYLFEVMDMS